MKNNNKHSRDTDFLGWIYHQANLLRSKEFEKVDLIHLIEEIEALGNSEKSKLEAHLAILLLHLLKIKYQPEKEGRSWHLSIKNARHHVIRTLEKNPSLKHYLSEIYEDAYFSARLGAAQETGLEEDIFPKDCPWTIEEILKGK